MRPSIVLDMKRSAVREAVNRFRARQDASDEDRNANRMAP
jgi:hypothetical protein